MLRDLFYDPAEVAEIATDHHRADLDEVDVAIMDFAALAAENPSAVTQEDIDRLRQLGLSDREIFDISLAVAVRAFFATLIETLGTRAEQPMVDDLEPELLKVLAVAARHAGGDPACPPILPHRLSYRVCLPYDDVQFPGRRGRCPRGAALG